MSKLKTIREQQFLTQEELAARSGISVRTIQRIESGMVPKGFTLRSLAKALSIAETELLDTVKDDVISESHHPNLQCKELKWVNLLTLLGTVLPPLNIIVPLVFIQVFKCKNQYSKQLISLQIFWTILAPIVFLIGIFLKFGNQFTLLLMMGIWLSNVFIILRNAYALDKHGDLRIKLNFNLI